MRAALPLFLVLVLCGCREKQPARSGTRSATPQIQVPSDAHRVADVELPALLSRAQGGDAEAAYRLSLHYLMSARKPTEHRRWLEQAARAGYPPAQYSMGYFLYSYGRPQEAREWLEKARESGAKNGDHLSVAAAERLLEEMKATEREAAKPK